MPLLTFYSHEKNLTFFNFQQFIFAVESLSRGVLDSYQLSSHNTIITRLQKSGSRHNAPMSPHTLTQVVRNGLTYNSTENLVVCFNNYDLFGDDFTSDKA